MQASPQGSCIIWGSWEEEEEGAHLFRCKWGALFPATHIPSTSGCRGHAGWEAEHAAGVGLGSWAPGFPSWLCHCLPAWPWASHLAFSPSLGQARVPPHIPSSVTRSFLFFRAENYWWRGQNKRTLKVGQFPRNTVTSVAGLSAHDISQPLKNSFIHTGHGDTNPQHCWGFPDKIDE